MKKIISVILSVVLLLSIISCMSLSVSAETYSSGDFNYKVYVHTANDDSEDYYTAGITKYTGSENEIEIPSEIDGYVVTNISQKAFSNCNDLTKVTIPDSVKEIEYYAFQDCKSLTSIIIPDSVTEIGNYAFSSCSNLSSVIIGKGITRLPESVFRGCKNLKSITIPENVQKIGMYAFYGSGIESITIPDCVTNIDWYAFSYSNLKNITIPNSITGICPYVFSGCKNLTSVTMSDSVTKIHQSAFMGCSSLASIIIPDRVWRIEPYAFFGCKELTNIEIPDGVRYLDDSAFYGCTNLKSVSIGDNVTSISKNVFFGCTSLTNVSIGNSVTSIGNNAFQNCKSLTSIIIPDSVTSIGNNAFNGSGLTSILIPSSVTSIGDCAFYECEDLLTATIPYNFNIYVQNFFPEYTNIKYSMRSQYTINFNANGGSGAPKTLTAIVLRQTSFTVPNTIPVRVGYTFEGWSENENGSAEYLPGNTYTINKSITLYAVWKEANTYTIKYNLCGGTGDFPNQIKTEGINLKLYSNRPAKAHYSFAYWLSSDQITKYYEGETYIVDASDTLYAVWKESCPTCHGSQYSSIITCSSCKGTGSTSLTRTCITCNGTGKTIGYKTEKCERCNGAGTISGYGIDTYGNWQWMTIACPHCDGKGSNRIEVSVNCSNCSGCGTVAYQRTCSACDGEGAFKTKCAKCDGKGSIYHYPRFDSINYIIGDSNYDGIIDVLDATMVQKFAVEKTALTEDQKEVADVNDDGVVDILDASDIQKFAVEKITDFKKK